MDFGSYLRSAREKRRLTLDAVSIRTKIRRELLCDLENNHLSRWPKARVYRLGYVRSYAQAVGLDPADVVTRFDDEFPDEHPVAFHKRRRRNPKPLTFGFVRQAILGISVAVVVGAAVSVLDTGNEIGDGGQSAITARSAVSGDGGYAPDSIAAPPASVSDEAAPADVEDAAEIEGELRIVSAPPHARVTVNGIGRGETPLHVRYLPLGSYTIRVIHDGYRARETRVTLKAEQPSRTVRVALQNASALARVNYSTIRE